MRHILTLIIATSLSIISYAQVQFFHSESILTSTSLAIGYEDLVAQYVNDGSPVKSNEEVFRFLENSQKPIGERLAVICAWGWSPYVKIQNRGQLFLSYLSKRYKNFELFAQKAPWDLQLCMAYLMALDNYENVAPSISLAQNAVSQNYNSYAARFILAMLRAHDALKSNWGQVYTIMDSVRNLSDVEEDISAAVRENVYKYSDKYKPYANGTKEMPTIAEQNATLANMYRNYNGYVSEDMLRAQRVRLYDMLVPSDMVVNEAQAPMQKIINSAQNSEILDNFFGSLMDENLSLEARLYVCSIMMRFNPTDYASAFAYYLYKNNIVQTNGDLVSGIGINPLMCYFYMCTRKYPENLDYNIFNMIAVRLTNDESTSKTAQVAMLMARINNFLLNDDWCEAAITFDDACDKKLITEKNVVNDMFAYDLFEYMRQCSNRCAVNEPESRKVYASALEDYLNHKYDSAYIKINEALGVFTCPRYMHVKAWTAFHLKRDNEAIEAFQYCIKHEYRKDDCEYTIASIYSDQKKYALSNEHCDSALVANPLFARAIFLRALNNSKLGKPKVAIEDYKRLIGLREKVPDFEYAVAYNNLAYAYIVEGDYESAKMPAEEALALSHLDDFILDTYGELQYHLGNYEKAIFYMSQAITIDSIYNIKKDNSLYIRGLAREKLGRHYGAARDLQRAQQNGNKKAAKALRKVKNIKSLTPDASQFSFTVKSPSIMLKSDTDVEIVEVRCTDEYVAFTMKWHNTLYDQGAYSINPNTYIIDTTTGKKYHIFAADNCAIWPQTTPINLNEEATFTFYFEALPQNVKSIDFYESEESNWKFFGINLEKH